MGQTERIYKLNRLFETRKLVTFAQMCAECEVSRATMQRDLECLRTRYNAPIVYDREAGGYRLDVDTKHAGPQFVLPGVWFSAEEIHAMLTMQHLIAHLDPGGMLRRHIAPLQLRINQMLGAADDSVEEVRRRVLLVGIGRRRLQLDHFQEVGSALLQRKRLQITYYARSKDETTDREVSPQRLVHYRENWYLDAWCHLRNGLRIFALDAVRAADLTDTKAREVPAEELSAELQSGYGIFSGKETTWATLRFSAERARYVSLEMWHSKQRARWEKDGRYVLEVPYSSSKELAMDILRYGADVEVLAPANLRKEVAQRLREALGQYA